MDGVIPNFGDPIADPRTAKFPVCDVSAGMGDNIQPSNPPASTICSISAIVTTPNVYQGRKVRFLGW